VETVKRFHTLAEKGDWKDAMMLIDLDAKCGEMIGDIYTRGQPEEQATMRDIWQRKLIDSTEKYLDKHFGESLGTVTQTEGDESHAVVVQEKGKFRLIYTLEVLEGKWRIVDRGHELDGVRPNPRQSMDIILARIKTELGREPTLADLNERLEEYIDRLRVRQIKVQH